METAERRMAILKLLCRRREEKIANLASEFGVSERTIRRDIEILSRTEPIYTLSGRYEGGVYIMADYYMDRMYMSEEEIRVLKKLKDFLGKYEKRVLDKSEQSTLRLIIKRYTKPAAIKKGEKDGVR